GDIDNGAEIIEVRLPYNRKTAGSCKNRRTDIDIRHGNELAGSNGMEIVAPEELLILNVRRPSLAVDAIEAEKLIPFEVFGDACGLWRSRRRAATAPGSAAASSLTRRAGHLITLWCHL